MADTVTQSPEAEEPQPMMVNINWIAELALSCSKRHAETLLSSGQMPLPVRLSNLRRWPRSQITLWIESGCLNREQFQQWVDDQKK